MPKRKTRLGPVQERLTAEDNVVAVGGLQLRPLSASSRRTAAVRIRISPDGVEEIVGVEIRPYGHRDGA